MKTTKFKPSEVGPIPVEWEVKRLGDCCKKIGSGATPTGGATVYLSHGVSLIRSQNVYNGYFKYEGLAHITDSVASALDGVTVQDDDVLLNITGDSVARCTKVPADVLPARVNQHVAIIRTCSEKLESDYLQCYLASPDMQMYMLNVASGQGGSRNAMTKGMVGDFQIPVPPLPEQRRIAEALSDVDALLAAMTTLIEKKRAIKQGAMQELLGMRHEGFGMRNEPIRRLAGFSGAWVEKRLGECGNFIGGGTPSTSVATYWGGSIDWYTPAEIGGSKYVSCSERKITREGLENSAARVLPVGTILLATRASIGLRAILRQEAATNQGFQSLVVNEEHDSEFMYYFLSTVVGEMESRASGSTFLEISSSKIKEIPITIPPILAEQKAIAAVLSDMDAEIAALEAKRAKYERIKQGMMQELLTGKTRLLPPACAQADAGRYGPTRGTCGG